MTSELVSPVLNLIVHRHRLVTPDDACLELGLPGDEELPSYEPGAHVELLLPDATTRQYSLIQPWQADRRRYLICVRRAAEGRGGSRFVHASLRKGSSVRVAPPRNFFALEERAAHTVLIGGGIGITPLLCMAEHLDAAGRSWELHDAARCLAQAPLRERVNALGPQARLYLSDCAQRLDIGAVVADVPEDSHLYCCGPAAMLSAFRAATAHLPRKFVHFESFDTAPAQDDAAGAFWLTLARSGRQLEIPAGLSILDALAREGMTVPSSCRQGVCGACETAVLTGTPEHRDMVLSEEERRGGRTMMICCSRSQSPSLVLDL